MLDYFIVVLINFRMAVLASREQTCIHEYGNTKMYQNKTEMCHELLDPEKVSIILMKYLF